MYMKYSSKRLVLIWIRLFGCGGEREETRNLRPARGICSTCHLHIVISLKKKYVYIYILYTCSYFRGYFIRNTYMYFFKKIFLTSFPPESATGTDIKMIFRPRANTPGALTIYYNVRGACLHAESGCVSGVRCRTDSPTNAGAPERS